MLQPLRGKLLIEVLDDAKRTESGLYLAMTTQEIPHRGKVISIGALYRDLKQREYPWGFQEGHIVHFKRVWSGEKNLHIVLRRDQIFAVECEDKAYAIGEYVIVKKEKYKSKTNIILPNMSEVEVAEMTEECTVLSVGRESKIGVKVGDRILINKNEGLSVRIPLQDELWSIKPKDILAEVL